MMKITPPVISLFEAGEPKSEIENTRRVEAKRYLLEHLTRPAHYNYHYGGDDGDDSDDDDGDDDDGDDGDDGYEGDGDGNTFKVFKCLM